MNLYRRFTTQKNNQNKKHVAMINDKQTEFQLFSELILQLKT